ncbi:MAG: hypothetical protein HY222_06795 [Thaumarchaeota archaeon]|nr:hypothetical protein [Nitrososphaerota archaeon]
MFRRWYGSPRATKRPEFMRLLKFLRVTKKDVFYDLGCGYADPCIWVSKKVKLAIGVENNCYRVCKALVNTQKSNNKNIKILKMNVENADYENASIIYTVIDLAIKDYKRIQRNTKNGTRLVICYPPPYPLKSKYAGDGYYVMT